MENRVKLPAGLLRQADAIFAALIANPGLLEQGRAYGLRFGISPLGAMLLAERHGEAGKRAAANMVELDYVPCHIRVLQKCPGHSPFFKMLRSVAKLAHCV